MTNRFRILLAVVICLVLSACKKQDTGSTASLRLQKIVTNGADSMGNLCNSCLHYELYNYDLAGKLISIRDSNIHWLFMYEGPHPYTGSEDNSIQTFQYDIQGRLIRSGTDSFVYNNGNQVIKRFRQLSSDPTKSYFIDSYAYDTNGRLLSDSIFTGKTVSNPAERIVTAYILFTYDNNDNVIKKDWVDLYQGAVKHSIITAQYDNSPSPFKNLGFAIYVACTDPFIVSNNNVLLPGYSYEYYSNGYLKKISYQGFVQEFFYQ